MDQVKIGKFIASLRKGKNMTQEQFAQKMGVSINAVSKWERGISFPDVSLFKKICNELNISIEELINGEKDNSDEAKEKALNKISDEWNNNLLADLLKELDEEGFDVTLTGFDLDEAKELFGKGSLENVHEDNFDEEMEINNIENPVTKQGDLWLLDEHRLVCCDSTNDEYYTLVLNGKNRFN